MTQPASDPPVKEEEKRETIALTDRQLVCILIAHKHKYNYYRESGKTVFEFDAKETNPLREKWKLDEPIPLKDVRDIYRAQTSFNSATRD